MFENQTTISQHFFFEEEGRLDQETEIKETGIAVLHETRRLDQVISQKKL